MANKCSNYAWSQLCNFATRERRGRLSEILVDHKSGPCIRNHLINMVKGQIPRIGTVRQKDAVVEMLAWWHGEKVVYLGDEGVIQCTSYQWFTVVLWTEERGHGRSWPVLTPWPHCSCPVASGAECFCWDRDKNNHARTPLPTAFAKSHSARRFSHRFPNTQLYSFLAWTQKSGCSHERGHTRCPRRWWPSWAEGTTHHQRNTLAPVKQWWVHVRIQEHTLSHSHPFSNTHRCACVSVQVIQIFHAFVG